jgi:DNA-binding IclR family transcriptional regulator
MAGSDLVQSLDRGLRILELAGRSENGVTLVILAQELGLSQPTVFNLARTLVQRGFLAKTERPIRYTLGRAVFDLAQDGFRGWPIESAKMEALLRVLAAQPACSAIATDWLDGECLITMRMDASRRGVVQRPMQRVNSPYTMATSLCLLAFASDEDRASYLHRYPVPEYGGLHWSSESELLDFLEEVRTQGRCEPPGEHYRVAAPFFGCGHMLLGSLGAYLPNETRLVHNRLAEIVVEQAAAITGPHHVK